MTNKLKPTEPAGKLAIAFVRCYDKWQQQAAALLMASHPPDGMPRSTEPGNPTARIAELRAGFLADIKAVDDALYTLPAEYRQGIWQRVKDGRRWADCAGYEYADPRTWYNQQCAFLYQVAKNMGKVI